jgi:hypothetical protein
MDRTPFVCVDHIFCDNEHLVRPWPYAAFDALAIDARESTTDFGATGVVAGGLTIITVGSTLRVDPARLRAAAAAQAEVGAFVSGMATGQAMTSAADAMPGLASGAAAQFAGTVLDGVAGKVSGELSTHSDRLASAGVVVGVGVGGIAVLRSGSPRPAAWPRCEGA